MRSPFETLQVPREMACEFFAVFARFEYTLKAAGFLIASRDRAEPDWRKFARQAPTWLDVPSGSALAESITYLVYEPPQVQMRDLSWQDVPLHGDTETAQAIDATCRVRHNLFHGGKNTRHSPPGRDCRLVHSGLTVLMACLEQRPRLRDVYEQQG